MKWGMVGATPTLRVVLIHDSQSSLPILAESYPFVRRDIVHAGRWAWLRLESRIFAYKLISHISPFRPEPDPLASVDYVSPDEGIDLLTSHDRAT